MQLHQLAYTVAVAEEGSFTRAAERLHLAQPSLSRQVRLLERELGVTFFNRGPGQGPVTPTADGAALLPFLRRVLADVEATGAEARALAGMARGRVTVGATPSLVTSVLAPALVKFHEGHPGIDLFVVEGGSHQLVPRVAAGEVDLAGVLSFVSAGLGAAGVPAIALPRDGSLVGVPFAAPTLGRTVALARRGGRALARPARALADELLARRAAPPGGPGV